MTGELAEPQRGEGHVVDEQAGVVARVLVPGGREEPGQAGGHVRAAKELVDDGEQPGELGPAAGRVVLNGARPLAGGLPGGMRDRGDGQAGAALVDPRQDVPEADLLACGEAGGQLQDGALDLLLQGSSPASSAEIAASQSMLAIMVPALSPSGPAVMNRLVKSSRCSQQPHPMMNSAAASREWMPTALAVSAPGRSAGPGMVMWLLLRLGV